MKIEEYYNTYKKQQYGLTLNETSIHSSTVKDFYDDCIKQHLLDKNTVLAWHNMLMEYIKLPDAIFWVRQFESGSRDKITNRYNTRRACQTRFADGFTYVFVSNYDAHEIFNMISKGVVVTAQEFLDLMKNHKFPLHYDNGKSHSCEESDMVAYPHIGNVRAGTLTKNYWYLAHINSVNGEYQFSGKTINLKANKKEKKRIFPRGEIADWTIDTVSNVHIRKLPYNLTAEEKEIVIAHFLRFVDPLNYFVTPKTASQISKIYGEKNINIGECEDLSLYVLKQYESYYGYQPVNQLISKVRNPNSGKVPNENLDIDITYGQDVVKSTSSSSTTKATTKKKASGGTPKPLGKPQLSPAALTKKDEILNKIGSPYTYTNKNENLLINILFYLNNNGQLNDADIAMLTSDESKRVLGANKIVLALKDDGKYSRYLRDIRLDYKGTKYLITKEWVEKEEVFEKIVAWAKTKGIN